MSSPATTLPKDCTDITYSWIETFLKPSKTIINVERYAMLAAVFMLILTFLGTLRRRSRNLVVQYGLRGVYLLSFPLLSYTMGLMQGVIKNELFPVWAVLLVVLLGGTTSMSVERLDETKEWRKVWFESSVHGFYVGAITGPFIFARGSKSVYTWILFGAVYFMLFVLGFKLGDRMGPLVLVANHRGVSLRVAAHMTQLSSQPPRSYDPRSMQGYRYMLLPFRPDIPGGEVTLDEIWCHGGGVLAMDDDSAIRHLKDLCLSFALFRLTVRRYSGYSCPESGLDMTRHLVLQGLLPRGEEDYERAFQVIQVELAFLYDFFFTKYAAIMNRGVRTSVALSLVLILLIIGFGTYALTHLDHRGDNYSESLLESGIIETQRQDILVTQLLVCTIAAFQLLQVWLYCVSDWAKVSLVCKYLSLQTKTQCIGKLVLLIGKVSVFLERRRWFPHWRNKMDQYSFLDSFHYPRCCGRFLEKHSVLLPMFRAGRTEGKSIPVPVEVKKAIARTLKDSNGHITNGASALQRHGMTGELYHWTCQTNGVFTIAHVIMIWHIATSYCDDNNNSQVMSITMPAQVEEETSRLVATSLSKYCAYLVAFLPELLPGKPPETELMLDCLVVEARGVFSIVASDRNESLRELRNQGGTMLGNAAILGMKLESITNRWKLLADFWAELMLYIAPSDNVSAHIESLAQGGELITHVWALLMHAGILERPAAAA